MKLLVLTCCYKRYDLFKKFLEHLPKDVTLICVGDADENQAVFSQPIENQLSNPYGLYLCHPNKPLGKKWNYGLEWCKKFAFDYLIITGSDDFFSPDLWEWYKTLTVHYAGLLDMYFFDKGRVKYNEGFTANRRGEPHGAGRALHRSVLEAVDWKLWEDNLNEGLDASMTRTLSKLAMDTEFIKVQSKGFVAMDVKTSENIHKVSEYSGRWLQEDEKSFVLSKIGL